MNGTCHPTWSVKRGQASVKGSQARSSSVKQFGRKKDCLFLAAPKSDEGGCPSLCLTLNQPIADQNANQKPTEAERKMKAKLDLGCEGVAVNTRVCWTDTSYL